MRQLMDAELASRIGPKHAKLPTRAANWHGTTTGPVTLGGRRVSVERPRGRSVEGSEVELDTWAVFSSEDLLNHWSPSACWPAWPPGATAMWPSLLEPSGTKGPEAPGGPRSAGAGSERLSKRWAS